ncbi:centromere protein N isoform 2-T2 [Anomaloglossus baeobatrachus]|uniref:centromere protein N isoform X2 n=1 Tax=Anomaloglossus baeobatrachus TaxID=238106 RepID=UPI003F501A73
MAPTPGSAKTPRRQSIAAMDECIIEFIKRMIMRMSFAELMPTLKAWGFLAERDLQTLNLGKLKDSVAMDVVHLCENRNATLNHAADLDIVYNHAKQNQKKWEVYQLSEPTDPDMNLADVSSFLAQFKEAIFSVQKNVTIHFREFGDALWLRIAWGKNYMKPNQYRPTFIVYHTQTPYVFLTSITSTQRPVVCQGLAVATGYSSIQVMDLKGRCLESLKDIVFKRYSQPFQSYQSRSVPEESHSPPTDHTLDYEEMREKERRRQLMLKTFGNGPLPVLDCAEYKLGTAFNGKAGIADEIAPFRCTVKFSSTHLLESFRSLAHAGISEVPVASLLSGIPEKARNLYKVLDKKRSTSHRAVR